MTNGEGAPKNPFGRHVWKVLVVALCTVLTVAGCGSSEPSAPPETGPDAVITAYATEPQGGLVPTDTIEQMGGRILDAIFTGLYEYGADGTPRLANAESVTTADNQHFVVTLKRGWTFHDGTPVTARNYVRAWNYGAAAVNEQKQQAFFAPIAGYDEVAAPGSAVHEMSGLRVVDDHVFTVDLTEPDIDFRLALGHSPFFPLPDAFFDEGEDAFGQHPIGNGRYRFVRWRHNVRIDLDRYEAYRGVRPRNGGLSFVMYASVESAYSDLQSGDLDVLEKVPNSALRSVDRVFGDHVMRRPTAQDQSIVIPEYLDHFRYDEEGRLRRQALSRAIDRDEVIGTVFTGTRVAARDFTTRTVPGYDDHLPGSEVLVHDAALARRLWAQANAIRPWAGTFQIAYNADGDHKEWVDAVAAQISETLGIRAVGRPYETFKQIRTEISNDSLTSAARTGWEADYPSLLNFLSAQYMTGAGANDSHYANAEFDALIRQARQTTDVAASNAIAGQAQELLLADLPAIPLWDRLAVGATADGVSSGLTWNGVPDYPATTK